MLRAQCRPAALQDASILRRSAKSSRLPARQHGLLHNGGHLCRHKQLLHQPVPQVRSYAGFPNSADAQIPWMSLKERLTQQSTETNDVAHAYPLDDEVSGQLITPSDFEEKFLASYPNNETVKPKSQSTSRNARGTSAKSSQAQEAMRAVSKEHTPRKKSKQGSKAKQDSKNTGHRLESRDGKNIEKVSPNTLMPAGLELEAIREEELHKTVPRVGHHLDRVLFNPGVHMLQDPRTQVFNFDPYLATIPAVEEFDFEALGEYITSSRDTNLRELCAKYDRKYCGSTSSLSGILSHFHYLLSDWRPINFGNMSRSWQPDSRNFTQMTRLPAATFLHHDNGRYAIDADKEYDQEHILSTLGKSLEKFLILPKQDFDRYQVTRSHEISEAERNETEAYHYSVLGDFLIRSQLDAQDPRLPGTGVFDIKTRAALTIRMNIADYRSGRPYEIYKSYGEWDSFEREYVDMMRSTFLKYSLQVRMGRMDGIFVAYHNTERIFGFQYVPLTELDRCLHGTEDPKLGDEEFRVSVKLLNTLLDKATGRFPGQTLRLHVETLDKGSLFFFAEPKTEEQMQNIQQANKASLALSTKEVVDDLREIHRKRQAFILKEAQERAGSTESIEPDEVWDEITVHLEALMTTGAIGHEHVRAVVAKTVEESKIMQGASHADIDESVNLLVESLVQSTFLRKPRTPGLESDESNDVTTEEELQIDDSESESNAVGANADSNLPQNEPLDENLSIEQAESDVPGTDAGAQSNDLPAAGITQSSDVQDPTILSNHNPLVANNQSHPQTDILSEPGISSTDTEVDIDKSDLITASDHDAADRLSEPNVLETHETAAATEDEFEKNQDLSAGEVLAITQSFLDKDFTSARSSTAGCSEIPEANGSDGRDSSQQMVPGDELDEHVSRLGELLAKATNDIEGQERHLRPFESVFSLLKADPPTALEANEESSSNEHSAEAQDQATDQVAGEGSSQAPRNERNSPQLLGLEVSVTNLVDGKRVDRPTSGYKQWHCQYRVRELSPRLAAQFYAKTQLRRKNGMMNTKRPLRQKFAQTLRQAADRGRAHRASITLAEQQNDVIKVAWDAAGLKSSTPVFK